MQMKDEGFILSALQILSGMLNAIQNAVCATEHHGWAQEIQAVRMRGRGLY